MKEIRVDSVLCNKIEALQYEIEARKDLLFFCMNREMDLKSQTFQEYHKELVEFTAQYEMAKKELEEIYFKEEKGKVKWNLDFATQILSYEVLNNEK